MKRVEHYKLLCKCVAKGAGSSWNLVKCARCGTAGVFYVTFLQLKRKDLNGKVQRNDGFGL